MDNTLIEWLLGACGAVLTFLGAVAALIVRATYKLGQHTTRAEIAAAKVEKIEKSVEKIPVHETRLGTLENVVSSIRSDIKELLRGRRPPSQPDWSGEE